MRRKAQTAAGIAAEADPASECLTIMVDLHESGWAHGVVGRMDGATRRYSFTRVGPVQPAGGGLSGAADAMVQLAQEYAADVYDGRS